MLLVTKVEMPPGIVSAFMGDLLSGTGRVQFGNDDTLDLLPAGSSKTGDAVVLTQRGSKRGGVSAATARKMALQWLEAAEATESDQLLSEAMRAVGITNGNQANMFGYLKILRMGDVSRETD